MDFKNFILNHNVLCYGNLNNFLAVISKVKNIIINDELDYKVVVLDRTVDYKKSFISLKETMQKRMSFFKANNIKSYKDLNQSQKNEFSKIVVFVKDYSALKDDFVNCFKYESFKYPIIGINFVLMVENLEDLIGNIMSEFVNRMSFKTSTFKEKWYMFNEPKVRELKQENEFVYQIDLNFYDGVL